MSAKEERRRIGLRPDSRVAPLLKTVGGKSTVNNIANSRRAANLKKLQAPDTQENPNPTRRSTRDTTLEQSKNDTNTSHNHSEPVDNGQGSKSSPQLEDFTRPPESSDSEDSSDGADIRSQFDKGAYKSNKNGSQSKARSAKGIHAGDDVEIELSRKPYKGTAYHAPPRKSERTRGYTSNSRKEIRETQSQSERSSQLMSHLEVHLEVLPKKSKSRIQTFGSSQTRVANKKISSSATVRSPSPEQKSKFRIFPSSAPQESLDSPKKVFKQAPNAPALLENEAEKEPTYKNYYTTRDSPSPEKMSKFKTFRRPITAPNSPGSMKRTRLRGRVQTDTEPNDSEVEELTELSSQLSHEGSPKIISKRSPRKKRLVETNEKSAPPRKPNQKSTETDNNLPDEASSHSLSPHLDSTKATCPMCGAPVPLSLLLEFSSHNSTAMSTRAQARFCTHHHRHAATTTTSYPSIVWPSLPTRIRKHLPSIRSLVADPESAEPSHYRKLLADDIAAGRNRTLKQSIMSDADARVRVPGYYGPRGGRVMQEEILDVLAGELREAAVRDAVVSARGVGVYVTTVLVLEVGVRLVMEDLGLKKEEAREVMEKSAAWGSLVNEELEDKELENLDDEGDDGLP